MKRGLALLVALLVVTSALAAGPAAGASVWVDVAPADLTHGDTEQSMDGRVEGVSEPTTVTVNVTSLVDAGVDLSNASVTADGGEDLVADATLEREAGDALIRVALDPANGTDATEFAFDLTLVGLDTASAAHTRIAYGIDYPGGQRTTRTFDVLDPDLPWVSTVSRAGDLLTGERNASQTATATLVDVPAADAATVRLDLAPLTAANVSLATLRVETAITEPDRGVERRSLERDGTAVELVVRTETETDLTVEFTLRGLDTRDATPTDGLRYEVRFAGDAGTASGRTDPFGVYDPDDTPSPTPPPTTFPPTSADPTADGPTPTPEDPSGGPTPTPTTERPTDGTPTTDGTVPGFGLAGTLLALVAVALARREG